MSNYLLISVDLCDHLLVFCVVCALTEPINSDGCGFILAEFVLSEFNTDK